eukprot:1435128-Heterocapsa_arctica.AAC.1
MRLARWPKTTRKCTRIVGFVVMAPNMHWSMKVESTPDIVMSSRNSSSLVMLGWPSLGLGVSKTHGRPSFVESTRAST